MQSPRFRLAVHRCRLTEFNFKASVSIVLVSLIVSVRNENVYFRLKRSRCVLRISNDNKLVQGSRFETEKTFPKNQCSVPIEIVCIFS